MNEKPKGRKILCLDFDGTLTQYSGWKGAQVIPDPPVSGAIRALALYSCFFEVHIFSSRSHQWGGRRAMKKWIQIQFKLSGGWTQRGIDLIMKNIHFPKHKPAAHVTIDDRALTFNGEWPSVSDLQAFQPWNKKEV